MTARILYAPDGSRTVRGDKTTAHAAWGRLSNEAQSICLKWMVAASNGQIPRRPQLVAAISPDLMESTLVVEALPDRSDYRYVFVGQREIAMRGGDPTGRTVRECFAGEGLDFVLESYDLAVREKEPCVDLSIDVLPGGNGIETETVFLPLTADGVSIVEVMVYSHYTVREASAAGVWSE